MLCSGGGNNGVLIFVGGTIFEEYLYGFVTNKKQAVSHVPNTPAVVSNCILSWISKSKVALRSP